MIELLQDYRLDKILFDKKKNGIKKLEVGYNLFTLSSYNNQLENFHSDVIASLLQPKGLHGEDNLFLIEFLTYLNKYYNLKIELNDFQKPIVKRESGRLDILIFDEESKKAIIFENKINDAPDMDEQLIRYYKWCKEHHLDTIAILYISLQGLKKAPPVKPEMEKSIRNIAAFSNNDSDLLNGWISPSIEKCKNIETKSLLIQYSKLLIYLAFDSMERITMDEFYKVANEAGFLDKIKDLSELTSKIPSYRADKFQRAIDNYRPFKKSIRYNQNYILFVDYWEGQNNFKLDIIFESDGSARIALWNPQQRNKEGNDSLVQKVNQITYLDKMEANEDNSSFTKRFELKEYSTMEKIDAEIIYFTKGLMNSLRLSI